MDDNTLMVLGAGDVRALLDGQELRLIEEVRRAYEAHRQGASSLPHSSFLRFPQDAQRRIIALPAYLGAPFEVSGIKWIASYPSNLALGLERASATVVLNSVETGRPLALLEGSLISAARTAASAALAASVLHRGQDARVLGLIGCGVINRTIARFALAALPQIETLLVYDLLPERAAGFAAACRELRAGLEVRVARRLETLLAEAALVALATTATEPHIADLSACRPGSTLLHISLRDLAPQALLACDNVVDDVDHVCRAQTSLHLAEGLVQHRGFIRCTLADVTAGAAPARAAADRTVVFSPFGLGVLDLAVGLVVLEAARARGLGAQIRDFLP